MAFFSNFPVQIDEKRLLIQQAFRDATAFIETSAAWSHARQLSADWHMYQLNIDARRQIGDYFVEILEDGRWTMMGAQGSRERETSLNILRNLSWEALSSAIAMYRARQRRRESPPAPNRLHSGSQTNAFLSVPVRSEDPVTPNGNDSTQAPSRPHSSHSIGSDMMFSLDK